MMINADIIAWNLAKSMDVRLIGLPSKALKLRRAKFHEPDRELEAGFVYVSASPILDGLPSIPEDSLLICVGNLPKGVDKAVKADRSVLRAGKGALLFVDEPIGHLVVFNAVQDVFERYTKWDEGLREILDSSGNIRDMVDLSIPVLENPVGVIDQDLNVVVIVDTLSSAREGQEFQYAIRKETGLPAMERLSIIRKTHAQNYIKRKPFFFVSKKTRCYCINLYVNNCYSGMMALVDTNRPLTDADLVLFEYFAELVLVAYREFTHITGCGIVDLRNVFHALMNGEPVSDVKISRALSAAGRPDQFICLNLRQSVVSFGISAEYVCAQLESLLPGSIAIPYKSAIAGIISLNNCPYGIDEALNILDGFLKESDFLAGVSNVFTDLQNVSSYFVQARCAIETGSDAAAWSGGAAAVVETMVAAGTVVPTTVGKRYFLFKDYVLSYIISQAQRELAPPFLVSPGLLRLKAHDSHASSEYWRTLRVYLESAMNVTLTAKKLYLNRSTLHQRLKRIEKLLELDLKDPYNRLYILFGIGVIEHNERTGSGLTAARSE